MSKMQDRLKLVMDYLLTKDPSKFKTQVAVANYIGYPQSNLSAALKGNERYLTEGIAKKFCDSFPEISYTWIIEGSGTMLKNGKPEEVVKFKDTAKRIIEGEDYIWQETTKIPEKAGLSLMTHYFAESYVNELEKGKIKVKKEHSGKYWEVEACGDSMNDGTPRAMLDNDWYTARDIPRDMWKHKLHFKQWNAFYILHNERGHIIKEIVSHDPETGEIELASWNPDKKQFPNFKINIKDCYIVANIVQLTQRNFNIFY